MVVPNCEVILWKDEKFIIKSIKLERQKSSLFEFNFFDSSLLFGEHIKGYQLGAILLFDYCHQYFGRLVIVDES